MGLGCFQNIAVRMLQAFDSQTHCPAINVDPAGGTRGQEGPKNTDTPDQYGTTLQRDAYTLLWSYSYDLFSMKEV